MDLIRNGRQMSHWQLKEAMGFRAETKFPPDFETGWMKLPEGEQVRVLSSNRGQSGKQRFGHRVVMLCPGCKHSIPAGRVHQHRKACKL